MVARARQLLTRCRIRQTRHRVRVLDLLLRSRTPLSQQQVHASLDGPDRVTTYRVLDTLVAAGIVHRIEAGDRVWRFAVCGCTESHWSHCHPHFTCRACGRTECLSDMTVPEPTAVRRGYVIEDQRVYFRGLCSECSAGQDIRG